MFVQSVLNKCMRKSITKSKQKNHPLKFLFSFILISLLVCENAQSQAADAIYPLEASICSGTKITLKWSKPNNGVLVKWQEYNGTSWTDINTTAETIDVTPITAGQYQYRAYINFDNGASYSYTVASTVNVYAPSKADNTVSFNYLSSENCESNNIGTVQLNTGYTGTIKNWLYSETGKDPWLTIGNSTNTLNYNNLPATTYYKVEIQNGVCPSVITTNAATITVIKAPNAGITTSASATICQGTTTLLSVSGNSSETSVWQQLVSGSWNDVASNSSTYSPLTNLVPADYSFRVSASSTCYDNTGIEVTKTAVSNTTTVKVSPTTAVVNPTPDLIVQSNESTINTITAPVLGSNSVLRWELSTDGNQWTPVSNATNTYSYSKLTSTTYYRVVTKDGACSEAVSSVPVKITVAQGGTISATTTSFCSPSAASLISLSGYTGTSFEWEKSTSPFTSWSSVQLNGNILNVSLLTETTKFRVNVNSGKAYSNEITLTVNQPTVAGSITTPSTSVCANDATLRTISLNGNTGTPIRWEYSNYNGEPWTALANTNTTLTFNNISQSTWYRAVVQNGACTSQNTSALKVEVVNGGSVAGSTNICANDANIRTITLSGHTGVINYWERSEYDIVSSTWGPYQNVGNGGSVNFTFQNLTKSSRYRAVITSSCATDVVSSYAEIIVNSASVGGTLSSSATVRPGDNAGTLSLAGNNGSVVRWEYSLTNTAPWSNIVSTSTSLAYSNLDKTTYYRVIVQNGACSEAVSNNTVKITMALKGEVAGSIEICANDATVRTLSLDNYNGTISRWQQSVSTNVWTDIATTATKNQITYSNLTQTTLYRAVITEDGNDIYADYATVTVNPLPIPSFTAATVCFNNPTSLVNTSLIASGSILSSNWNFNDGKGSSITSPTYTFALAKTHSVKLIVVSDKLCKDSVTQNVVVSPLPATDFTVTNVCENKTMSFTNNTSLAGATLAYTWTFGNGGPTSSLTDPTHVYPVKGSYDVTLNAVANGLCSKSLTKTVTVYENPVADFSFTNICDGTAMNFVNTSYITSGNLSYAWDFGDAGATSTLLNPTNKFSQADTFHVKLTVTSANACENMIAKKVQVYAMPVVDFTPTSNCFGQATIFKNNSTITSGSMTYAWDFKNGNTSVALNPTQTYNSAGSYYAKLTAISDWSCTASKEKEVIIHYNPKAQFSYNNICANDTVRLVNMSSSYGDNITYSWNFGDASGLNTSTNPLKSYSIANTYPVKLIVTSSFGCKDSVTQNVMVYPNPKSNFTFSTLTCGGAATQFTSSATLASGIIKTYNWDFGTGSTSNLKNPNYKFGIDGSFKTILTVTTDKGCSDTISKIVSIASQPVSKFVNKNTCATTAMPFTNKSTSVDVTTSYLWTFGDSLGTSTDANPTYVYSKPGTYKVKLVVQNGNSCIDSSTYEVEAFPIPVVDFVKIDTCVNMQINFKSKSTIASGAMNYLWDFGNGLTSILAEPNFAFTTAGTYPVTLKVTSDKGCVAQKTIQTIADPIPVVSFSPTSVCYGKPNVFTNTTQIASGEMSYEWNFGDLVTDTTTSVSHLYTSPGKYNVKLTALSDKGCLSTITKVTEVYSKPKANFIVDNLCASKKVTFANTSSVESGTMTYVWVLGNDSTSSSRDAKTTYLKDSTYSVTLYVNTNNGCSDTVNKSIVIYPLPIADFTTDSVCDGFVNKFVNKTTIPASAQLSYYQWDFGDLTNSLQLNPEHQFLNQGNYTVRLLARSSNGCESSISKVVTVMPVPTANFSAETVCLGKTTSFKNTTSNITGTPIYAWKFGEGSNSDLVEPSFLYQKANTYGVTLIAKSVFGCVDSLTKGIVVNALPIVKLGNDTTVSRGFEVTFAPTVSAGKYAWSPSKGLDNTILSKVKATPDSTIEYMLTVTDINGCVNSDTIKLNINADYALKDIEKTISNVLTPDGNKQNDFWVIPTITFYPDNTVYIFDRWGQEVYKATNYQNNWSGLNHNGDKLPDGTYYFVITFEKSKVVHKGTISLMSEMDNSPIFK